MSDNGDNGDNDADDSDYGMSLLSHNAYGWYHIQWTNIREENGH